MQIYLTKTISEQKGLIEGEVLDWARPAITEMTRQVGRHALIADGMTYKKAWAIPDDDVEKTVIKKGLEGELDWFRFGAQMERRLGKIALKDERQGEAEGIKEMQEVAALA